MTRRVRHRPKLDPVDDENSIHFIPQFLRRAPIPSEPAEAKDEVRVRPARVRLREREEEKSHG